MTEQQFTYWLQGFAELSGDAPPTAAQWRSIREHLALCFMKMTPPVVQPHSDDFKTIFEKYISSKPADAMPQPRWNTPGKLDVIC